MASLPGTDERFIFRVIPSFRDCLVRFLGAMQVSVGVVTVATCIAVFITKAFTSVGGTGVIAALLLIGAGITGIIASYRKEIWAIILHVILAFLAMALCLALLAAGVTALHYESRRQSPYSLSTREALDVCAISMSVFGEALTIASIVISLLALCYSCCKVSSGATYVGEPNVMYDASNNKDEIKLGESALGDENANQPR